MRCSNTLEHEHVKQRIHAENLCPRGELRPEYMIVIQDELQLA
jgi:hypothetical protein